MSPAKKEEWAKVVECETRIRHLEETVKELKQELRNKRKEEVEGKRYISNRRLALYLCIASIFGGIAVTCFDKLLEILV